MGRSIERSRRADDAAACHEQRTIALIFLMEIPETPTVMMVVTVAQTGVSMAEEESCDAFGFHEVFGGRSCIAVYPGGVAVWLMHVGSVSRRFFNT